MPTYEYECRSCGSGFDVFQSMSDDPLKVCPACGKAVRRKINGGGGIIFKGSGFYKNDSRNSSAPRDGAKPGGEASKSESSKGEVPAKAPCESCSASSSCDVAKKDAT